MNACDDKIARDNRLCRGKVVLIPGMGVPRARYAPASDDERAGARRALGIRDGDLALLCAAEFSPRKNQRVLLEALSRLPEDVVLLLPGDGALLTECRALAEKLGILDRVRFPGHVSDVTPWLRAADACVSVSRSEGLPFHVMEAMGCALPCVLSRVKGHEDLLSGGKCGLLVPYGGPAALAAAVEELRRDPELRRRLGAQGAERRKEYARDAVLPQVLPWFMK